MVPSESVEPVDVKLKLVIPVFRKPVVGVTWAAAVGAILAGFLTVRGVAAAVDADWRAAFVCALGLIAALAFLKAFLWRNRPQSFAPGAIPGEVLP